MEFGIGFPSRFLQRAKRGSLQFQATAGRARAARMPNSISYSVAGTSILEFQRLRVYAAEAGFETILVTNFVGFPKHPCCCGSALALTLAHVQPLVVLKNDFHPAVRVR